MFYLLLALPHILGLVALLWIAYRASTAPIRDSEADGGPEDGGGGNEPMRGPRPSPSDGGIPLPHAAPPWRRPRDGERLAELYPPRSRRGHPPLRPREPQRPTGRP